MVYKALDDVALAMLHNSRRRAAAALEGDGEGEDHNNDAKRKNTNNTKNNSVMNQVSSQADLSVLTIFVHPSLRQ